MTADSGSRRLLRRVLVLGVALRVLVAWFLAPANNDPHLEFIEFMVAHGRLPYAGPRQVAVCWA